jgi:hypothetical protein
VKGAKATPKLPVDKPKRPRRLKTVLILATIVNNFQPSMDTCCFFELNDPVSSALHGESRTSRVNYSPMTHFAGEQSRTNLIVL